MQIHSRFTSKAARPAKQLGGGCLMLFGLPFLLGGLATAYFWYLPTLGTWWSARHWNEVPCWVERADLKTSAGSKGSTLYELTARYRYREAGRTFYSEQVGLVGGADNLGGFQLQHHAELQPYVGQSQPFRCYVNPRHPEQAVLFRDLRWGLLLLLSIFPMVFPVAGLAVIGAGLSQMRAARAGRVLEARYPGEAWRWRPEWAGEVITPQRDHNGLLLVLAAWMLLVQAPLAAAIVVSGGVMRQPLAVLGLLPTLLALIPLHAVWRTARLRRTLGRPALWLRQSPAMPGRTMEGELRFGRVLSPLLNLEVRLLCQRHITRRSGSSNTTAKETIWEQRETLPAAEARRDLHGSVLPLHISIPPGLPCSAVDDLAFVTGDDARHVWTLEVAPAGSRQKVMLPVPVFPNPDPSAASASDAAAAIAHADTQYEVEAIAPSTEQLVERLRARGVGIEFDAHGLPTLIDCPPGRFRGVAWFLILFGLVWSVAFIAMLAGGAPVLFLLFWGVTSPLILGSGVWTLLHRRQVRIAPDEMRVTDTAGPFYSRRQSYAPRHFVSFSHDSNMSSGSTFYYRVLGETTFGKKLTLIDGITESVTAETLADRLEKWRQPA